MTKLDKNDLVEYSMLSTLSGGFGALGHFMSAIFYLGIAAAFGLAAVSMLLGALGIL